MTLFCYSSLESCPVGHLVTSNYREEVAESINSIILAHQNLPTSTPLIKIVQQLSITTDQLSHLFNGHKPWVLEDMV
jgi:hypothetical protein